MKYKIPKNAIIESIKETNIDLSKGEIKGFNEGNYKGLKIETTEGNLFFLIDNFSEEWESFGAAFFDTPDSPDKFIGSKILEIEKLEIRVDGPAWFNKEIKDVYEDQFRIVTSKGVLQYALYDDWGGHYTHASIVQIFDYNFKDNI